MSHTRGEVDCDIKLAKDCIKTAHYAFWPMDNGWVTMADNSHC